MPAEAVASEWFVCGNVCKAPSCASNGKRVRNGIVNDTRGVPRDFPAGTVTFLFTDIEGSTRLLQKLGSKVGFTVLDRVVEPQWRAIRGHFRDAVRKGDLTACFLIQDLMTETMAVVLYRALSAEAIRALVVEKDLQFFNQWRPANEPYIFGFRKQEQSRNQVELPHFGDIIGQVEQRMLEISQPKEFVYELKSQ